MISLFAITFSLVSLLVSIAAIVIVLAQKWSTHKIEWKPLEILAEDQKFKDEDEEKTDLDLVNEALQLSRKKKKKLEDPLDEILETNNF
jgi:superfamily I DNA and RNA helicase